MATPVDSANLILKLYELRREETMRKARDFVLRFNPKSADDYMATIMGPNGAYVRQVTSYWDMAATFVIKGAIDMELFNETAGEHILVFGKIEPFLADLREKWGNPNMMANLEKVCLAAPGGIEHVRKVTQQVRAMIEASEAAAAGAR